MVGGVDGQILLFPMEVSGGESPVFEEVRHHSSTEAEMRLSRLGVCQPISDRAGFPKAGSPASEEYLCSLQSPLTGQG